MGLASEWRFIKEFRKFDSRSIESEYKTNLVKGKIDKYQKDTLWRLCRIADECLDHGVSGCSKLEQKEYKGRYDN